MKRTFVPLFLMVSFLILLFDNINFSIITVFLISLIFFMSSIFFFSKRLKLSYILIIISISLLFGIHFQNEKNNFNHISKTNLPIDFYITVYAKVIDFPISKTDTTILFIKTEKLIYEKKTSYVSLNIRVSVIGKTNISKGDKIRLNLKISHKNFSKNFFHTPINSYFLTNKIHFSASCKSAQMISLLEKHFFWNIIENIRINIKNNLSRKYPEKSNKKAFIKAILLGDRGDINQELKENLLNAGIFHIFAISGAHIGIISFFLIYLLNSLE